MTVVRPDLLVGDRVFNQPDACYCDDVNACMACLAEAEKLIGVRVRDADLNREFTIGHADTKDAMVTVGGSAEEPYWAPVYDLVRAKLPVPERLHPLQEIHRYLFPERYDAVETYEWTAGTIEDVAAIVERLASEQDVPIEWRP